LTIALDDTKKDSTRASSWNYAIVAFSAAGRLLNSPRSSLDIVIVSMCMALRSWLRAGILHDEEVDQAVISVAERVEYDALEQLAYGDQVTRVTQWIAEGEPRPGSRNRGNDEVDDSPE